VQTNQSMWMLDRNELTIDDDDDQNDDDSMPTNYLHPHRLLLNTSTCPMCQGKVDGWQIRPVARQLDDDELLLKLSICAMLCYSFEHARDQSTESDLEFLESSSLDNLCTEGYDEEKVEKGIDVQYGVFRITEGEHKDKIILAIRGSKSLQSFFEDFGIMEHAIGYGKSERLMNAIKTLEEFVETFSKVDFVCGHSLGGFLAEIVASKHRIPGASFNNPGPWVYWAESQDYCGYNFEGLKFEVHLTSNDIVSTLPIVGEDAAHISMPVNPRFKAPGLNPLHHHSAVEVVKNVENLLDLETGWEEVEKDESNNDTEDQSNDKDKLNEKTMEEDKSDVKDKEEGDGEDSGKQSANEDGSWCVIL